MSYICSLCNREAQTSNCLVSGDEEKFQNLMNKIDTGFSESNPDWNSDGFELEIANIAQNNTLCAMCAVSNWVANVQFVE